MTVDVRVRETASVEEATQEAKVRCYVGARLRLRNARKRLISAQVEYDLAKAEVERVREEVPRHGD